MTVNLKIQEPRANARARGHRLKTARQITGLTRKAMSEKYGISASTIQSWEAAKAGGLTTRGVNKVLPILQQEGVACNADWLLYGIGAPPQLAEASFIHQLAETALQPRDTAFIQELCYFRQLHPDGVDLIIADDGMAPHYQRDDVVAGKKRYGEAILTALGQDCVVQTVQNEVLFRRVKQGRQPERYHLVCTNPDTSLTTPVLYDQQLLYAAPMVWHRRNELIDPGLMDKKNSSLFSRRHGKKQL